MFGAAFQGGVRKWSFQRIARDITTRVRRDGDLSSRRGATAWMFAMVSRTQVRGYSLGASS
jgi:hypothetical protein